MRFANVRGRAAIVVGDAFVDISSASDGRFGPDPQAVLAERDAFAGWAKGRADDLAISCSIDGDIMQEARTSDLIFSVPNLIARLSAVCPLAAGDIIFTGTLSGVGAGRKPSRFLRPNDVLSSFIAGIGALHTTFTASPAYDREPAPESRVPSAVK